ncbi:MAG: RNA polymerase sigma factor [Spirosomataceae bacterium]
MTDREIYEGCLRKDPKAQATLYQRYKGRFFGVCRRYTRCREEAEDVFQDAFVKVFLNLHELRQPEQLSFWIHRVVVNVCIDFTKKQVNLTDINELPEQYQPNWESESIISQMSNAELMLLVNELPDGARMVFNMYVIDGYTHVEIAKTLNISEGTSKSQLFFAKKLLKEKIEKQHLFSDFVNRL